MSTTVIAVIELENRVRSLEHANHRLTLELSDSEYHRREALAQVDRLRADRNARYQSMSAYREECAELKRTCEELKRAGTPDVDEIDRLKREHANEVATLRDLVTELRTKVTAGNKRNHKNERDIKSMNRELDQIQACSTASRVRTESLEQELAQVRQARDAAIQQASRANEVVKQARQALAETNVRKKEDEEMASHFDFTIVAAHNSLVYFGLRNLELRRHIELITTVITKAGMCTSIDPFEFLQPTEWDVYITAMPTLFAEQRARMRAHNRETMSAMAIAACQNIATLFGKLPIKGENSPRAVSRHYMSERA